VNRDKQLIAFTDVAKSRNVLQIDSGRVGSAITNRLHCHTGPASR